MGMQDGGLGEAEQAVQPQYLPGYRPMISSLKPTAMGPYVSLSIVCTPPLASAGEAGPKGCHHLSVGARTSPQIRTFYSCLSIYCVQLVLAANVFTVVYEVN